MTVVLPVAWNVGAVSIDPDSGTPMSYLVPVNDTNVGFVESPAGDT